MRSPLDFYKGEEPGNTITRPNRTTYEFTEEGLVLTCVPNSPIDHADPHITFSILTYYRKLGLSL